MRELKKLYDQTEYYNSVYENSLSVFWENIKNNTYVYKDNLVKALDINVEYGIINLTVYDKRRDEVIPEFKFTLEFKEFFSKVSILEED